MDRFKFRAWDKQYNMMVGNEDFSRIVANFQGLNSDEWANLTWMQCTGLKDKNGVLIYEGDIIWFEGRYEGDYWCDDGKGFVKYEECEYFLQGHANSDYWCLSDMVHNHDGEIVGNIYENGDLLNGK